LTTLNNKSDEEKQRINRAKISTKSYSYIANSLFEHLDHHESMWYNRIGEFSIDISSDSFSKTKIVDYVLGKKIIEFYGDMWHANPAIYKESQRIPRIGKTAKEIQTRDAMFNKRLLELRI
jgi:hypothetical protein